MTAVDATRNFFDLLDDQDDPTLDALLEEDPVGDDEAADPIEGLTGQGDELVFGARPLNAPLSVSMGVAPSPRDDPKGSRFEAFFTSHGPSASRQEERKAAPVISLPAPAVSSSRTFKYTREELLGLYRPDLPLPADFEAVEKVTLAESIAPVALGPDSDERGKASRRGGREARGRGGAEPRVERRMQKSEFGWGHDAPNEEIKKQKGEVEDEEERGGRSEWRAKKEGEFERNKDKMLAEIEAERKRLREERERETERLRGAHEGHREAQISVFDSRGTRETKKGTDEGKDKKEGTAEVKLTASGSRVAHVGGPQWFYKDPKGVERGPFSSSDMAKWLQHDYFTPELLVRRDGESVFLPLATLCLRFQANPFTGMPLVMWCQGSLGKFQKALLMIQQKHIQEAQQLEQMVKQARSETPSGGPIFGPTISATAQQPPNALSVASTSAAQPHAPLASAQWFYKDPKGGEQGPFSSADMDKWLRHNFFKIDLLVRRKEEAAFQPLAMLFMRLGMHPFTGVPLAAWLNGPHSEFQKNFAQNQQRQMHFIQAQTQQREALARHAHTQPVQGGPVFGPAIPGGASVPQMPGSMLITPTWTSVSCSSGAPPQSNAAAYAAYQRAMQAHMHAFAQHAQLSSPTASQNALNQSQELIQQQKQQQQQQQQRQQQQEREHRGSAGEEGERGEKQREERLTGNDNGGDAQRKEREDAKGNVALAASTAPKPNNEAEKSPAIATSDPPSAPSKPATQSTVVSSTSAFESLWDLEFASSEKPPRVSHAAPGSPVPPNSSKSPKGVHEGSVKSLREIQKEEMDKFKATTAHQPKEAPKPSVAPWSNQSTPAVNLKAIQHEEAKAAQERQRILRAAQEEQRRAMEEQARARAQPWGSQQPSHALTLAEIQEEEARVAAQKKAEQERMREAAPARLGGGAPWGAPLGARPLSFAEIQEQERQKRVMEQQTAGRRIPAPVVAPPWGGQHSGSSSLVDIQKEEEEKARVKAHKTSSPSGNQAELGFWDAMEAPPSSSAASSSSDSAFPSLGGEAKTKREEKKPTKHAATPSGRPQQRQSPAAPTGGGGKKKRGQVVDPSMMGFQSDLSGRNVVNERTDPAKLQDD